MNYQMKQIQTVFLNRCQTDVTEFTVSASLKLAQTLIEKIDFRDEDIMLICQAIKLLFLSVQMWRNATADSQSDEDGNAQETKSAREDVTRQLLGKLGSKLKRAFYFPMQEYYRKEPLLRELKVRWFILSLFNRNSVHFLFPLTKKARSD